MKFIQSKWFLVAVAFVLGALVILGIRFATYKPSKVHYHANFAVYLNGSREKFQGSQYYEEDSGMCSSSAAETPLERTHMHDNVNNVVHVEDNAVTWGDFFMNLGWYLGPNFIQTDNGTMYMESGANKLNIILNGHNETDMGGIADTVIKDQDKLLVSFGPADAATLQKQYASIPATAHHYDVTPDPKGCSGSAPVTLRDRLSHLF